MYAPSSLRDKRSRRIAQILRPARQRSKIYSGESCQRADIVMSSAACCSRRGIYKKPDGRAGSPRSWDIAHYGSPRIMGTVNHGLSVSGETRGGLKL